MRSCRHGAAPSPCPLLRSLRLQIQVCEAEAGTGAALPGSPGRERPGHPGGDGMV